MSDRPQPFGIVTALEAAIAQYTGAPSCVTFTSCTKAIGCVLEYHKLLRSTFMKHIEIPKFTYIGVPMQIKRCGFEVRFREEDWSGEYYLSPYSIWDSARRFRKDMWFENGSRSCGDIMGSKYKCLSFHRAKILGHTQGGAVITNDYEFVQFATAWRFDGRTPGVAAQNDKPTILGDHCYMDPETAAALLHNLYYLPDYNPDLPKDPYPDLSQLDIFK